MDKYERNKFLEEIKADVRQYTKNIGADSKTKAVLDAKLIRSYWRSVGEDIRFGIRKVQEEIEDNEK